MPNGRRALSVVSVYAPALWWMVAALGAAAEVADPSPPKSPSGSPGPIEIYTLRGLLNKAEWLVSARLSAPSPDGLCLLISPDILKKPNDLEADRAKQPDLSPDDLRRAQALLEGKELPPTGKPAGAEKPPAGPTLAVRFGPGLKPPAGANAWLFFLWEREPAAAGEPAGGGRVVYRVAHPQALYPVECAARVRQALAAPDRVPPAEYLRAWDRAAAARGERRAFCERERNTVGGEAVRGLTAEADGAKAALRGDGTFYVAARLRNSRPYPQYVYNAFGQGLGVRLRRVVAAVPPAAPAPDHAPDILFLFNGEEEIYAAWGLSDSRLEDQDDFAVLAADGGDWRAELCFTAEKRPELRRVRGPYLLSVFYASNRSGGKSAELPRPAWTGAVFSKEIPLDFGEDRKTGE